MRLREGSSRPSRLLPRRPLPASNDADSRRAPDGVPVHATRARKS
jgi:hypothetical protein